MRITRPAGRHQFLRSGAAVGITCLALLAGGIVGGIQPAEAATIPDNPCVSPPPPPPPPVTTSPVLTRVRMSTAVVDVRRRAKTVVITLKAHDSVPLSTINLTLARYAWKPSYIRGTATLVSGTATNGTWRASVTMPRGIPDGRYWIGSVRLYDVAGGFANYRPSRLGPHAWPAPFLVRSYRDRTAPTVTGFQVSTRAVDTRGGAQTVTLRVDTHDHLSGVASVTVYASGIDTGLEQAQNHGFVARLSRSTTHKHRWTDQVVVPMWVGISTWKLALKVRDNRRHVRHLTTKALARRGWQSTLRVTSGRDTVAPTLAALSFTPTSVDARDGVARVEVTFRVTDALSGVSSETGIGFSGADVVITSVSGTVHDRTYQGYARVRQCGSSQQSTMRLYASLLDTAGNHRWIDADELAALGFPTDLSVRQRDALEPAVNLVSLRAGGPLVLRFSEPVLMTDPLAALLRVVVDGSAAPGSWECRNGSDSVVVCDAEGAAVVTATFTPTTAFTTGDEIQVRPISSVPGSTGIFDLDGAPLRTIDVVAHLT